VDLAEPFSVHEHLFSDQPQTEGSPRQWSDLATPDRPGEFGLGSAAFHLAYCYNEDGDSSETQEENFHNWVEGSIAQTLGGSIGSAEFELRRALQSWSLIQALNAAELTEVRFVKNDKGSWSFEVTANQPIAA
jgi:hypothetical protein